MRRRGQRDVGDMQASQSRTQDDFHVYHRGATDTPSSRPSNGTSTFSKDDTNPTTVVGPSSIARLWGNAMTCRQTRPWVATKPGCRAPHLVVQVESDGEVPHGRIRLPELLAHLASADSSNNKRVRIESRCKVEKDHRTMHRGRGGRGIVETIVKSQVWRNDAEQHFRLRGHNNGVFANASSTAEPKKNRTGGCFG